MTIKKAAQIKFSNIWIHILYSWELLSPRQHFMKANQDCYQIELQVMNWVAFVISASLNHELTPSLVTQISSAYFKSNSKSHKIYNLIVLDFHTQPDLASWNQETSFKLHYYSFYYPIIVPLCMLIIWILNTNLHA